eukprot:9433701-Alexandrium_andersonii.AAC.1
MSREALGLRARADRSGMAAQLDRTAPPPECLYKQSRDRVRLPWGRRHTAYDPVRMEEDDSESEDEYEVDESPTEAAHWLQDVYALPPSLRASAHMR